MAAGLRLLLVANFITMVTGLETLSCPTNCRCYQEMTVIYCSSLKLETVPKIPSTVKRLYLDHNKIKTIQSNSFQNLDKLVYLNLDDNDILDLDKNAFHGLTSLKTLNLANNRLPDLHHNLLRIPRGIVSLDLSGNHFRKLPDAAIGNLDRLVYLNFSRNHINDPKLGDGFKRTTKIEVLDLSNNDIAEIQENTFSYMLWWGSKAIHLNLSYCNIQKVNARAFSRQFNLVELNLSGNKAIPISQLTKALKEIEGQGSSSLKSLVLSNMNLTDPTNLLNGIALVGLETLDLSHNSIKMIAQRPFRGLRKLKTLDLSYNSLSSTGDLKGLSSLQTLILSHNHISVIQPESMEPFSVTLKNLYLSHNKIERIMDEMFEELYYLTLLDLGFNEVKTFQVRGSLEHIENLLIQHNLLTDTGTIPSKLKLKSLDISHNRLTYLGEHLFKTRSNLQFVNFSRNLIREVSNVTFTSHTPKVIDLSNNNISRLENYGMSHVTSLNLRANRISSVSSNALKGLSWLKSLDLSQNQLKYIWSYNFNDLDILEELSLSGNSLGGLCTSKNGVKLLGKLSKLRRLNLESNDIKVINPELFRHSSHLESINLSNNSIETVTFINPQYLQTLKDINLSKNNIENINPKPLQALTSLQSCDLSHNPFHCSCDLVPFRSWVASTHVNIKDFAIGVVYQCKTPEVWSGKPLRQFDLTADGCSSAFDKRIIFIAAGGLGLLIITIGGILFYRHRWRIKRKLARRQYGVIHQNDTLHLQQQHQQNHNPAWI